MFLFSHQVLSDSKTPWTAACQASLSHTVSWSFIKFMSTASVMLSNHLIFCQLLLSSIFPSIWVFSNNTVVLIKWLKYCSFSFSISPSNEYSGFISFENDWFHPLAVQGLSRFFSSTTVQRHLFFHVLPSLWSSYYNGM